MDHMQYLMVRSHNPEEQPFHHPLENADDGDFEHMSGHAMMASAPTHSHIMTKPADKYPHDIPADMTTGAMAKLLDLSNRLPIDRDGEITPIMAWTLVLRDPRVRELEKVDLERLRDNLLPKVTCYGLVPHCIARKCILTQLAGSAPSWKNSRSEMLS